MLILTKSKPNYLKYFMARKILQNKMFKLHKYASKQSETSMSKVMYFEIKILFRNLETHIAQK